MLAKNKNYRFIEKLKNIFRWTIGVCLTLYLGLQLLLNVPSVQRQLSAIVASQLSHAVGSKLSIGRIEIGIFNRIIIEDIRLDDQSDKEMLRVARLAARFELLPLFNGKIAINNIQFYGFQADLKKDTPTSEPNYQFLLDVFAAKDTIKEESKLDLRINSALIRRGRVAYHVLSEEETPGKFNPNHIQLKNIAANVSLKALNNDSVNASIRRFSVEEELSNFRLDKLDFKLLASNNRTTIEDFSIHFPQTSLVMDTIRIEYDSLEALKQMDKRIRLYFHLKPSDIAPQDIAAFVPAFRSFKEPLKIELKVNGTLDNLRFPTLSIQAGNHFQLRGDISLKNLTSPERRNINGHLSRLYADSLGMELLVRNFSNDYQGVPSILKNLGTISFQGELAGKLKDLQANGLTQTDRGYLNGTMRLTSNPNGTMTYSGVLETTDFELGKTLGNSKLGDVTFNLDINAQQTPKQLPYILLKGVVASLDYNGYDYQNITLDGEYKEGGFSGKVALDDENGLVELDGYINTQSRTPVFNFLARVAHFRPHDLRLTSNYVDSEFSVKLRANFTGSTIDRIKGEVNIDSLLFTEPENNYLVENFKIEAAQLNDSVKNVIMTSDFMNARIEGIYSYTTLPATVMNILHQYLPSVITYKYPQGNAKNDFRFELNIAKNDFFETVLKMPLTIYAQTSLKGYINNRQMRVEGYFPRLRYDKKFIESGALLLENPHDRMVARLRFNDIKEKDALALSVEATAQNDSLMATFNWGNNIKTTYNGKVAAVARFVRQNIEPAEESTKSKEKKEGALQTIIDIKPTQVTLNDTLWQIRESQVIVESNRIHVNDFYIGHSQRHLRVNGILSESLTDTVHLDLKDIDVAYVFDMADLGVDFSGKATGPAFACGVLKEPVMKTDLFFRNLGLNNGLLGNAQIHGEWHHPVKGIYLDAYIREADIAKSHVTGYIYPLKPTSALDLQIEADSTNLKFIHHYLKDITSNFNGRASGDVHLYGKFKALTLQGKVNVDASMFIDPINTSYSLKDSILVEPTGLTFVNNRIFDSKGRQGTANGYLRYRHFKDIEYRLSLDVNNMLVMDTKESLDFPFYGTIYGTGNVTVSGTPLTGLNVDAAITTNRNSTFTYLYESVSSATSNQFITFVDKTPRRTVYSNLLSDFERDRQESDREEEVEGDIRMNIQVEATPDVTVRIIMDPIAGDNITCRGSGNIRADFYNKGDVRMFGNYNINQGAYRFSIQEVIRKDFTITDGSYISFTGPPEQTNLDLRAKYTVISASLNDLIPNASSYVEKTNIKVDCIMNMTGQLTSPALKLGLEMPDERDEVAALVRNYIPTEEQMNMQILYLLGIGKFYASENVDGAQNSNMMSNVLSSTLSGQLNNVLTNIINSNDWSFGTNLSTGERGWSEMEFETMLSGQLLNNRLRINGNFGYRENPLANTNFVGDFEAEWLVTRNGDIRLRAYNETNDRYYTRTNLTTQGIGIVLNKDFERWSDLLFWNKWRLKWLQRKVKNNTNE